MRAYSLDQDGLRRRVLLLAAVAMALAALCGIAIRRSQQDTNLAEPVRPALSVRAVAVAAIKSGIPPLAQPTGMVQPVQGRQGGAELVLLDRSLADLAPDLRRDGHMVLLVGGPHGLENAASQLNGGMPFKAIHIVSHGQPGRITLDGVPLDTRSLQGADAAGFAALARYLQPGGDILIYGCESAQGRAGRALLRAIAGRTGANVAGSDRVTGIGEWSLAQQVGEVTTATLRLPVPVKLWTNELYEGGWFGDSNVPAGAVAPHPKAGQTGSGRLSTIGDNLGGSGVAFSVQSLACCTAQRITSASATSYAAAVTANDYFYSNIVVGGANGAAISKFQYNQVINNAAGAQFQLALYDTVTTALTPITGAITVSGSATSLQLATTPVGMVAGRTYQLRFYGFNCGGSATCYIDNPQIWTTANEAPNAVADSFATGYTTAVAGNVTANDSDPEGQALTVSSINGNSYTVGTPIALAGGALTMTSTGGAFTFTPASGFFGSQSFTYGLSDGFGGTATGTATIRINQADLSLAKTVAGAFAWQGGSQSFTLTVSNSAASSVTATGITVRDALPDGFGFTSATGTGSFDASTGVWTVGALAPGASASLTLNGTVTASPRSVVTNAAEIISSSVIDPDSTPNNGASGEDDQASASFTVIDPGLSVSKTSQVFADGVNASAYKAIPGASVRYCILVTNTGNTTASGIVATDSLPVQVSYISGSARTGATCAAASSTQGLSISGTNISASSSALAPGQTFAVIYDVTIG